MATLHFFPLPETARAKAGSPRCVAGTVSFSPSVVMSCVAFCKRCCVCHFEGARAGRKMEFWRALGIFQLAEEELRLKIDGVFNVGCVVDVNPDFDASAVTDGDVAPVLPCRLLVWFYADSGARATAQKIASLVLQKYRALRGYIHVVSYDHAWMQPYHNAQQDFVQHFVSTGDPTPARLVYPPTTISPVEITRFGLLY